MTMTNPLAADDDGPLGEYPDIPARSGVTAVLNAADKATEHALNLQSFVHDLWKFCEGKHVVGVVEIRNLMANHHV
jgi:hypothetical protein